MRGPQTKTERGTTGALHTHASAEVNEYLQYARFRKGADPNALRRLRAARHQPLNRAAVARMIVDLKGDLQAGEASRSNSLYHNPLWYLTPLPYLETIGKVATTGEANPTDEGFGAGATEFEERYEAVKKSIAGAIQKAHRQAEAAARKQLKLHLPQLITQMHLKEPTHQAWNVWLRDLPRSPQLQVFYPPPPNSPESLQYTTGFYFGVVDSLVSLLRLAPDCVAFLSLPAPYMGNK